MTFFRLRSLQRRASRSLALVLVAARATAAEPTVDAAQMPRVKPLEPGEAVRSFQVRPGFRAELVAAEPLVHSPVAVDVDEEGAAYVVEMRDYSERRPEQLGRIRRLTSSPTAAPGRYDHADVFLANLPWPTAIACWDGGVFIGATPDIIYAKDTNGDGVADIREVVFTGFASAYAPYATNKLNVQALLNSFHFGLDHRIHGAASMSAGKVHLVDSEFTRKWRTRFSAMGPAPVDEIALSSGSGFSFDPRTLELRAETGGGQHGMSFDDAGRRYVCSNSDHLQQVLFDAEQVSDLSSTGLPEAHVGIASDGPAAEVFRRSPDEPWRVLRTRWRVAGLVPGPVEGGGRPSGYFTGATGVSIYRGDAWPEEFRGDAFVADCGSNLVHRKKLRTFQDRIRREGVRADDEKSSEFLASTDNWYRPVQFFNAPDGCLWVIDMYRETIEHPWSLPDGLKRQLDLDSGRDRGRLWRLRTESGAPLRGTPHLAGLTPAQYVQLLKHPNGWHRDTASRLLYERGGRTPLGDLRSLFQSSTNHVARLHALGLLHGLGALDDTLLAGAVRDPVAEVRWHAMRWIHELRHESAPALQAVLREVADSEVDEAVRLELALVLARQPAGPRLSNTAAMIRHRRDMAQQVAVALIGGAAPELFVELTGPAGTQPLNPVFPGSPMVLTTLARTLGSRNDASAAQSFSSRLPRLSDRTLAIQLTAASMERNGGTPWLPAVEPVIARAREAVAKGDSDVAFQNSVRLLSMLPWKTVENALRPLLEPTQSEKAQRAGVDAISRFRDAAAVNALIDAAPRLVPAARRALIEALVRRSDAAPQLLAVTHDGKIPLRDWTVEQMNRLRRHENAAVRARAEQEFGAVPADRQSVVDRFLPALALTGDPKHGAALFQERCAGCHQFKGQGTALGPDLASVVSNGPEKLLVSILDPNREVAPNFTAWTAESTEGDSVSGLLVSDNDSGVVLRVAGGQETRIPKEKLARLKPEGRSLMPEGLESGLEPQGIADLLAHLLGNGTR